MFVFACKGSLARQKFESKNSDGPLVNGGVVWFLIDELGGYIVDSAAEGSPSFVNRVGGPTEITQLYMHRFQVSNEDIFWLDVPMDHISLLQVEQRVDHLCDNVARFLFTETFLPSQLLIQVAMTTILEHHIDVLRVVEVPIQAHDVRVI